jgi:hypothetical protein
MVTAASAAVTVACKKTEYVSALVKRKAGDDHWDLDCNLKAHIPQDECQEDREHGLQSQRHEPPCPALLKQKSRYGGERH